MALVCVSLAYIQASSANTTLSSAMCCENSIGVTGKTAKMATKNQVQQYLHCSYSKTQVFHRHRWTSMGAKL